VLLSCASVSAQYTPGDVVVSAYVFTSPQVTSAVLGITSQGSMYTVTTRLQFVLGLLRPDPVNRALLVATERGLARIAPDGTVTSVFSFPTPRRCVGLDVDGSGSVILCYIQSGLTVLKYANGRVTTLHAARPPDFAYCGSLDLASGDLVAYGHQGPLGPSEFYRLTLGPAPRLTTLTGLAFQGGFPWQWSLHPDPESGDLLFFAPPGVSGLSLSHPPTMRQLHFGPPLGWRGGAVDRDPADGRFVVASHSVPLPNPLPPDGVFRFDARSATFQTLKTFPTGSAQFLAATVAGSRHLCGMTEARPGRAYSMLVSSPHEPGARYMVALSFGFRPGIPAGGGRKIYLKPDPLFLASATGSGPFYGFQGTLNAQGEAVAAVTIPNMAGLSGRRFFASAITIVNNQISVISDPLGVTIQ